jgi:hypothetical protein
MSLSRLHRAVPVAVLTVVGFAPFHRSPVPSEISNDYCWHDYWNHFTDWHCGDTVNASSVISASLVASSNNTVAARSALTRDTLYVQTRNRDRVIAFQLPPNYDAIFLSQFAIDTFFTRALRDEGKGAVADSIQAWVAAHWAGQPNGRMNLACMHLTGGAKEWECSSANWVNPANVLAVNLIRHAGDSTFVMRPGKGVDAIMVTKHACLTYLLQYYEKKHRGLTEAIERAKWKGGK